ACTKEGWSLGCDAHSRKGKGSHRATESQRNDTPSVSLCLCGFLPFAHGSAVIELTENIAFNGDGLVPVVVQDRVSGDVLMVAWANAEALERTAATGLAHFW